jgi:hypothetical protein
MDVFVRHLESFRNQYETIKASKGREPSLSMWMEVQEGVYDPNEKGSAIQRRDTFVYNRMVHKPPSMRDTKETSGQKTQPASSSVETVERSEPSAPGMQKM